MSTIYLIDNKDSFSYNLVDELSILDHKLKVYRNDLSVNYIVDKIQREKDKVIIVISPGPGNPKSAGNLLSILKLTINRYPILGICLGMQAIVEHFSGKIVKAKKIVHGKTSLIDLQPHPIFENLQSKIEVARYHSLIAYDIKKPLNIIASYKEIPMAIIHNTLPIIGLQFHPESVLTSNGKQILIDISNYLTKWN